MKRTIAALFLAGIAGAAFAQDPPPGPTGYEQGDVYAKDADSCPAGFHAVVPSYEWQNGHFVRSGELCKDHDGSTE
jgi:hypothetical protein